MCAFLFLMTSNRDTARMKLKRFFLLGAAATAAGLVGSVGAYQGWKRGQLERLETESSMLETIQGPIEYRKYGTGPAVLIAHGSPGGYDQGYAVSKLIESEQLTFIAFSRPGYLRTPLGAVTTPEAQADLYAALLDALGIEQAVIIGISGGGPSALQFALRHPDRCTGLVMISGVAHRYSELELREGWSFVRLLLTQIYMRITLFDPLLYLLVSLAHLRPDRAVSEELARALTMYHLRKTGYVNDMDQFAVMPDYPLEQIKAPTFVVHGMADDEVPFDHANLLMQKIPHAKLLAIPGGNHIAFYIHASTVMPALRTFLEALQPVS
jgi:pimeloyl-ACP methyl ester carboxylesterase